MKTIYQSPSLLVYKVNIDKLMLDTSNTPADPDQPVLGKEFNEGDVEYPQSKSVWED